MASNWKPIKIAYEIVEPSVELNEKLAPIILLHGMTQMKEDWVKIDQLLADATHRRVYKLDARNHGDSEWSDDFDFEILGEDVNHFMEQHKIPKAILIGHSMGGRTAMEVAGKYPNKIEKIIVEDMTPFSITGDFVNSMRGILEQKSKILSVIPADADLEQAKTFIRDLFLEKIMEAMKDQTEQMDARPPPSSQIDVDLEKTDEGFRWKTNYKIMVEGNKINEMLSNEFNKVFDGSVLFICGPKSFVKVLDDKDRILEKFPKAIFEEIADATHLVHGEYPEKFVQASLKFIKAA